ncbi:hypothetical protein EDD15DRAFT_2139599, partial [Pisolithus albus]
MPPPPPAHGVPAPPEPSGLPPPGTIPPQPTALPPPLPQPSTPMPVASSGDSHVPVTPATAPITNNTLEITPRPPCGFPEPQLGDSITRGLDKLLSSAWLSKPGPKAWIRPWRAKLEPDAEATYTKLRNLIQWVVGQEASASLVISTPQVDDSFTMERHPPPWHFLVSGLSKDATDFLVGLKVISTPECTAFTLPFTQPVPTYLCTVENFTLPDSPASNAIVAGVVIKALRSYDLFTEYFRGEDPNPDVLATFLNSIYVTSLHIAISATRKQTLWNVYCSRPPSFLTFDKYFTWQCLIRTARFSSEDYGMGVAFIGEKQFKCLGCKSLDHPTGLCPFPTIPGWLGPKPQLIDTLPTQATVKVSRGRNYTPRGGEGHSKG